MIYKQILKNDFETHTIWQTSGEGVGEPALSLRDYVDGMVEVRQGENGILINYETLPELIKVLTHYRKKVK